MHFIKSKYFMKTVVLLFLTITNFIAAYAQSSFGFDYKIENKKTIVTAVYTYGPSAKAGLQKGDVIIKINDIDFTMLDTTLFTKTFIEAKESSAVVVNRNGTTKKITITKAERSSFLNICISGNCLNGKGVFVDKDGNEFNGEFNNEKKMGKGKILYINGNVYEGNWVMNKPEGDGKIILYTGDIYNGKWYMGEFSGNGIYTVSNGETYTGVYKNGHFDGTVKHYIKNTNETFIEMYKDGVFVSSKKEEKNIPASTNPNSIFVTINYDNGDEYVGYTFNKSREGTGKYTYKTGAFYEGNWANDKINGFGKYSNGKGVIYEGNWKNNIKDGKGKEFAKNGNITEQNWINGKLNGNSISTVYKDGVVVFIITQAYIDDKETGNPKVVYPNGDVYEGQWQYGTPYGIGQFTYNNGDIAKGNFWNGKKTGLIELKTKKGKQLTQYYKNDSIAGVFKNEKLTFTNGDIFEGQWKDGLEQGAGKLTTKQEIITGFWARGFLEGVAVSVSKEDGTTTTYQYRQGIIIAASLNPKKFTAQIIKLVENPGNNFNDILLNKTGNEYQLNEKLNGFSNCVVKNYKANISSTGKEAWVYTAETVRMTKVEALEMCSKLEAIFEKIKFSATPKKEIEYNVATRRLINYNFDGKLPVINVDAGGDEIYWTVTIRINK